MKLRVEIMDEKDPTKMRKLLADMVNGWKKARQETVKVVK